MQAPEQLEAATEIAVRTQDITAPKGFRTHAGSIGIKDGTPDYSVIVSAVPCVASGVFTRSLFAGASVTLCRERLIAGQPQAIVTVSKNANVATGAGGLADARELAALTAQALTAQGVECPPDEVLVCSTGVIGRRPDPRVLLGRAPVRRRRPARRGPSHHDDGHRAQAGAGRPR
jgi:glutamate N-acetyltransferase / amino-acid N-acetyltransferase